MGIVNVTPDSFSGDGLLAGAPGDAVALAVAQARTMVEQGADLIDVKEPKRGPLGAADFATLEEIVAEVAGQAPLSAACGELIDLGRVASRGIPAI
jgi:dihydropteroate synthase